MTSAKRTISVGSKGVAALLCNPDGASVKRIAWGFACARKDSDEEAAMYRLLVERMEKIRKERRP